MLTVGFINDNLDKITTSLEKRNFSDFDILNQIIDIDIKRKNLQKELEALLAEGNTIAAEIKNLYKSGRGADAESMKKRGSELKSINASLKIELSDTKTELQDLLLQVPNCANEIVPPGKSEEDNQVHQAWPSALPQLLNGTLPHWDLAKKYNLINFI